MSSQLRLCSHMQSDIIFQFSTFNQNQKASTFQQLLSSFTFSSSLTYSPLLTHQHFLCVSPYYYRNSIDHVFRLNNTTSSTSSTFKPFQTRIRSNDLKGCCSTRGKCWRVGTVQNSNFIEQQDSHDWNMSTCTKKEKKTTNATLFFKHQKIIIKWVQLCSEAWSRGRVFLRFHVWAC